MNNIKAISKINERELEKGVTEKSSWHQQYKDSPYVFLGGLDFSLTEGDLRTVFSQYGKVVDINLARDKETNASRGFAFLGYQDPRSAILAVDNFNGIHLAGRTIRVDHVLKYKTPEELEEQRRKRSGFRTKYAEAITDELFKSAAGDFLLFPTDFAGSSDQPQSPIKEDLEASTIETSREDKEERRRRLKVKIDHKRKDQESKEERRARKEAKKQKREEKRRKEEKKRKKKKANYKDDNVNRT